MIRFARWIKLVATPGRERDVAAFLIDALPVTQRDVQTLCWFGMRLDRGTFAIFDAFDSDEAREAKLRGPIAEALQDRSGSLFAAPKIRAAQILAAKLPPGG